MYPLWTHCAFFFKIPFFSPPFPPCRDAACRVSRYKYHIQGQITDRANGRMQGGASGNAGKHTMRRGTPRLYKVKSSYNKVLYEDWEQARCRDAACRVSRYQHHAQGQKANITNERMQGGTSGDTGKTCRETRHAASLQIGINGIFPTFSAIASGRTNLPLA